MSNLKTFSNILTAQKISEQEELILNQGDTTLAGIKEKNKEIMEEYYANNPDFEAPKKKKRRYNSKSRYEFRRGSKGELYKRIPYYTALDIVDNNIKITDVSKITEYHKRLTHIDNVPAQYRGCLITYDTMNFQADPLVRKYLIEDQLEQGDKFMYTLLNKLIKEYYADKIREEVRDRYDAEHDKQLYDLEISLETHSAAPNSALGMSDEDLTNI